MSVFSERLSALRRERGISQRFVAAELHISQALLSHYENGAREPGLEFVCRICNYYGVTADYLLGRTEKKEIGLRPICQELSLVLSDLENIRSALSELDNPSSCEERL